MTRRPAIRLMLPLFAVFVAAGVVFAGGWATITLSEFPEYAVAGKPLMLTFSVRQHGQTPLADLKPSVRATTAGGAVANVAAKPGTAPGEYKAALTLPAPGEWTVTITSGFNESALTLPPVKVIGSGEPQPTPFSPVTRGVRLFTAKGCTSCHRHAEVNPERGADAKFDLTGRRFPQDYLKKFLADPSIKPAQMPNLKLKEDEIDSLAAFINKGVTKQVQQR